MLIIFHWRVMSFFFTPLSRFHFYALPAKMMVSTNSYVAIKEARVKAYWAFTPQGHALRMQERQEENCECTLRCVYQIYRFTSNTAPPGTSNGRLADSISLSICEFLRPGHAPQRGKFPAYVLKVELPQRAANETWPRTFSSSLLDCVLVLLNGQRQLRKCEVHFSMIENGGASRQ